MNEEKISIRRASTAIPGLLDLLQFVSEKADKPLSDFIMAEIGSYVGDSTAIFAERVLSISCIDPWKNGYDDKDPSSFTHDMLIVEKQFDELLEKYPNILKHKMTSEEAAGLFKDESLDMVYIDGNHLYEFVKKDVLLWAPKVKIGGFVAGHDWQHKKAPGVKPAILETIGQPDKTFQDTSWVKQKWS